MARKKKAAAKRQRVHVKFLQDYSGSMQSRWNDCAGGFASFVQGLQEETGVDYAFSLTLFNTSIIPVVSQTPIMNVNPGILKVYRAQGGTALYDALGAAMTASDGSEFDKEIYIIVTDGEERDSITWNKDSIHSLIDSKLAAGKSTFQYLGAQPETWDDASKMGFSAGQTVQYDQNNYIGTYNVLASATNNFSSSSLRSSRSMTASYGSNDLIKSANMCVVKEDDTSPK